MLYTTLMPNTGVSSLGGVNFLRTTQVSFDVRVEADVIALLRTVHVNTIDPDVKNHLRDLIFAYKQSTAETDLAPLVAAFLELGVTVVGSTTAGTSPVVSTIVAPPVTTSFGSSRPLPRFARVTAVNQTALKTDSIPVTPTQQAVAPVVSVPSYKDTVTEILVPQEKIQEELIVPTPTPTIAHVVPEPVPPIIENIIQPDASPVVVIAPQEQIQQVHEIRVAAVDVSARITEIKHFVNEKVGNPINLIDSHNEEGREYMNALLDAMKKSNGGSVEESKEAMERLERAFIAVKKVLLTPGELESLPAVEAIISVPEVVVVPEPVPPQITVVQDTAVNQVKIKVIPEIVVPVPPAESIIENLVEDLSGAPVSASIQQPETQKFSSVASNKGYAAMAQNTKTDIDFKVTPAVEEVMREVQQVHVAESTQGFHSVAEERNEQDDARVQRETITKALDAEEAVAVAKMDELYTPQVTAGLSQLLSEWTLFKSSGIFGTGPSGKDHVLYVKLAPLTMSAVIAGRFDGATTAIKQSIADYMNGWRYEEAIVYEHGETFEHYLRRVIHHILSKSTK